MQHTGSWFTRNTVWTGLGKLCFTIAMGLMLSVFFVSWRFKIVTPGEQTASVTVSFQRRQTSLMLPGKKMHHNQKTTDVFNLFFCIWRIEAQMRRLSICNLSSIRSFQEIDLKLHLKSDDWLPPLFSKWLCMDIRCLINFICIKCITLHKQNSCSDWSGPPM